VGPWNIENGRQAQIYLHFFFGFSVCTVIDRNIYTEAGIGHGWEENRSIAGGGAETHNLERDRRKDELVVYFRICRVEHQTCTQHSTHCQETISNFFTLSSVPLLVPLGIFVVGLG
jgi:hypothetical protein